MQTFLNDRFPPPLNVAESLVAWKKWVWEKKRGGGRGGEWGGAEGMPQGRSPGVRQLHHPGMWKEPGAVTPNGSWPSEDGGVGGRQDNRKKRSADGDEGRTGSCSPAGVRGEGTAGGCRVGRARALLELVTGPHSRPSSASAWLCDLQGAFILMSVFTRLFPFSFFSFFREL